jgi:branched-chain amino acid transport system substrate-binding protein
VDEFKKLYGRYPKMTALYGYTTAQFIARGFQKAGTVNKEKFIDAVEGHGDRGHSGGKNRNA